MYDFESADDDDDELEPRVKYADILQKEDYVGEEEEDGPVPYIDDGPGYYFFLGIE